MKREREVELYVIMTTSTRDFVLEVIDKYKAHPCLWQVKHADYHNRDKKNAAMNVLLDFFKTKDPNANLDTVKKKITSLRNCFKKEFNKVKTCNRSGAGTSEIHVPKLWYYSDMLFLADVDVPRDPSSVHSILDDMPFEEVSNDECEDTLSTNALSPPSQTASSVASSSSRLSRKPKAQADIVLAKIAKKMDETNPPAVKQQYDSFGEHIAEKLRNLPTLMAAYCQKIINDAIFMAETNNLTVDSHIVNNRSQVFFSQPNLNSHFSNRPGPSLVIQNATDHNTVYDANSITSLNNFENSSNQPRYSQITQNPSETNIIYDAFVTAMGETPENTE